MRDDQNGGQTMMGINSSQLTNEKLLCIAFLSYMGFSVAQGISANFAKSEALLGDAAAMMVDALTYLLNWYVEQKKRAYAEMLQRDPNDDVARIRHRKHHLQLELLAPLISVIALLMVTGIVLKKSITVLILDAKRDIALQSDPNLNLMLLVSVLNLFLDGFNVFYFAKAKHALGYETKLHNDEETMSVDEKFHLKSMQRLLDYDETGTRHVEACEESGNEYLTESTTSQRFEPLEIENSAHHPKEDSNLNMCSAYTHVIADSLRSLAVIIASILADFVPRITPEEADAAAAVVVSVLIAFSLVPLLLGMVETAGELWEVNTLLIEGVVDSLHDTKDSNFDVEDACDSVGCTFSS